MLEQVVSVLSDIANDLIEMVSDVVAGMVSVAARNYQNQWEKVCWTGDPDEKSEKLYSSATAVMDAIGHPMPCYCMPCLKAVYTDRMAKLIHQAMLISTPVGQPS